MAEKRPFMAAGGFLIEIERRGSVVVEIVTANAAWHRVERPEKPMGGR